MPHEIGGEYHLDDFPCRDVDPWPARRSFFASGRAALGALCRRWIETHSHARLWLPDYFRSDDFPCRDVDPWPARRSFFASGRAALGALCRRWIETHSHARLWLPDYFCPEVVSSLCSRNIRVAFYTDNPQRAGPELSHLYVLPGDMVLAVNYFGVRSGDQWSAWRESTPSVALIEDHTHDPQSLWARSSRADFAFASLRKTLPLPDGAIAWSPRELSLPEAAPDGPPTGRSLIG